MASADVVIVGGGANGTSTAFHLTRLGAQNVLLLERRWVAAGATGKSGALLPQPHPNQHGSPPALGGLQGFQKFHAQVAGDSPFEPLGFLSLAGPGYRGPP